MAMEFLVELNGADKRRGVFVIGATNRPEVMDPALLWPAGRFEKLLYVPLWSSEEQRFILKALGRKKHVDASVDLSAIGRMESCKNLSGADLAAPINEAAKGCYGRETDFKEAIQMRLHGQSKQAILKELWPKSYHLSQTSKYSTTRFWRGELQSSMRGTNILDEMQKFSS